MAYLIFLIDYARKEVVGEAPTIEAARAIIEAKIPGFTCAAFERDPDGHDAADAMYFRGVEVRQFAIEARRAA